MMDGLDGGRGEHFVLGNQGPVDIRQKKTDRFQGGLVVRSGCDAPMVVVGTRAFRTIT
jgi:hypothetical protein